MSDSLIKCGRHDRGWPIIPDWRSIALHNSHAASTWHDRWHDDVDRLRKALDDLRTAIKPFADFADRFGDTARDDSWALTRNPSGNGDLTMGDVRSARRAYNRTRDNSYV